jgi:uncharacterized membrane protein YebE (DUF533 family)
MAEDNAPGGRGSGLRDLSPGDRLLLLRLVCAFAWADGEIDDAERRFVRRLMGKLDLAPDESNEVESWLLMRPDPVDPGAVPAAHKRLFLESVRAVVFIDGGVSPEESRHFDELRQRLVG